MRISGANIINSPLYHPALDLSAAKIRQKRKEEESKYLEEFFTFDIETTYIPEIDQNIMYVWQLYYMGEVIIGRTWGEFRRVMREMHEQIPWGKKLVGYVHNLSYEFQFMSGIYNFANEDVFAVDKRKILKCTMLQNIEFRCSYLLSNMSLDAYCKKMKTSVRKLTGKFNYDKIRLSSTKLSRKELRYCVNDVVGLHEAITTEMSIEHDNVATIPLTSTGYIRRDTRKAMYKYKKSLIDKIFPTYPVYKLLRQAFRGGDTHANRYYSMSTLEYVKSIDIKSSYPGVLCTCQFPMTKFKPLGQKSESEMRDLIEKGNACLIEAVFTNVKLKDELEGCPYLSYDKCRGVLSPELDNGRILSAEMLETTFTDIDFKIFDDMYTFDACICKEIMISKYGALPDEFKEVIIKYFEDKTKLQGEESQQLYYDKSKNKLNSSYGMCAQNPVKPGILYDGGDWNLDDTNEMDLLNAYQKNAFLVYQWGVWVTAHARKRLHDGIKMAGHNFVYCDTDSVKYIGELEGLEEYNTARVIESEAVKAYAEDSTGKRFYMGVYEYEGCYRRFITFGAKKYAYTDKKGLHITIAGVHKKKGVHELNTVGGFKALKLGFIFKKAGGTDVVYNDNNYGYYNIVNPDTGLEERTYITRNMVVRPGEYTFKVTPDYMDIVNHAKEAMVHLNKNY